MSLVESMLSSSSSPPLISASSYSDIDLNVLSRGVVDSPHTTAAPSPLLSPLSRSKSLQLHPRSLSPSSSQKVRFFGWKGTANLRPRPPPPPSSSPLSPSARYVLPSSFSSSLSFFLFLSLSLSLSHTHTHITKTDNK